MPHFLCRLNPPRPTFAMDMTPEEQGLMEQHFAHWNARMDQGEVVVFGVVGDPAGPWGAGVVEMADEAAVRAHTDADPVIRADAGFSWDVWSMPNAVVPQG